MNEHQHTPSPLDPQIQKPSEPVDIPVPPHEVPASAGKKPRFRTIKDIAPFVIAIMAIAVGIGIFTLLQPKLDQPKTNPPITVIVTPTPSPTPVRTPTTVSSTQEFSTFKDDISTLSAQINEFEKDDPSLSPPNLVLPLGLDK